MKLAASHYSRRGAPLAERIEASVMPLTECGCWIWMKDVDAGGYGTIRVGKMMKAHRASWVAFKGEIPDELKVLHSCDVPSCVNPEHLFLGTQTENMQDMYRKGRQPSIRGGDNPNARLTEAQVIAIKSSKLGASELARQFGITPTMASYIKRGKSWGHL